MKHDVKTFNLFSLSIQELENFVFQSISNFVFHIISLAQQKAQVAYKKIILRLPLIRKSSNSINVYQRQSQAKQKKMKHIRNKHQFLNRKIKWFRIILFN